MAILFTITLAFLFTITIVILFTIPLVIQFTISIALLFVSLSLRESPAALPYEAFVIVPLALSNHSDRNDSSTDKMSEGISQSSDTSNVHCRACDNDPSTEAFS